jgi:adenylate cyclase
VHHRILVLAHDTALRASLARVLQQAGYQVELADSAKRARDLIAHAKFAVAIVGLDEQNAVGLDLARQVGEAVRSLILFRPGRRNDSASPELACKAYLAGPLDESRLLSEVQTALRQREDRSAAGAAASAVLRFDGFTLDVAGRTLVDSDQREVPLTPSEFALLLAFAQAPGRVLSRDQLRNDVAGRALDPYDRSIDVLVARLRRKIEADPKSPRYIVTFPGVGYKFVAKVQETLADIGPAPQPEGKSPRPADSQPASISRAAAALAVLPFGNLSGDPGQDYFVDGLVEELITALSRLKWFLVIARNSSFTYKGRAVDVKQVGRELGVQYVLEGSVRKSTTRVRITAQLVEAESGAHVWADKYDGTVEDIFDFQDHITACVVAAIEPQLRSAEIRRAQRGRPKNLTAYDYFLRGMAQFYIEPAQETTETLRLLSLAMKSDPSYAAPYALAAYYLAYRLIEYWSDDPGRDLAEAERLARAAIERDRDDPVVLALAGFVIGAATEDYGTSMALIERSLAINPNSATALQMGGWAHIFAGDAAGAIDCFGRGLRLSPLDNRAFLIHAGMAFALIMTDRSEEAVGWARKCVAANPLWPTGSTALAIALGNAGRLEEAREAAARVARILPKYRASHTRRLIKPGPWLDRYMEGARKAGIPD